MDAGKSGELDPVAEFAHLDAALDELQKTVIEKLQALLTTLGGRTLKHLEEGCAIAKAVQRLLQRLGLRLRCPHCGEPASLRWRTPRRTASFYFQHSVKGRNIHHGGKKSFPENVILVAAAPDKRKKGRRGPDSV